MRNSIINKLKNSGHLLVFQDYRSGGCKDLSGNGLDGTVVGSIQFCKDGFYIYGTGTVSNIYVAYNSRMNISAGTFLVFGDWKGTNWPTNAEVQFMNRYENGADYNFLYYCYRTADNLITLFDGTYDTLVFTPASYMPIKSFSLGFTNGSAAKSYINGTYVGAHGGTASVDITNVCNLRIGGSVVAPTVDYHRNIFSAALYITRQLTDTEHAQLHQELAEMKFPRKTYNTIKSNDRTNRANVVGLYDLVPSSQIIADNNEKTTQAPMTVLSPIVAEKTKLGNSIYVPTNKYTYSSVASNIASVQSFTIEGVFRFGASTGGTQTIFAQGYSGGLGIHIFLTPSFIMNQVKYGGSFSRCYVGGWNLNVWNHFVARFNSSISLATLFINGHKQDAQVATGYTDTFNNSTVYLGDRGDGVTDLVGNVCDGIKIYDSCKSDAWAYERYKIFSKKSLHNSSSGVNITTANVTSGFVGETKFEILSGTWSIVTSTINGRTVKALKCVSAGAITIAFDQYDNNSTSAAFGTWEMWFYKASTSNAIVSSFISKDEALYSAAGNQGYVFINDTSERLDVSEFNNVVYDQKMLTAIDYIPITQWYGIRITRTRSGITTAYINKNGTSWAEVVEASGANPFTDTTYTVSNYMVFDLDNNDMICLGSNDGKYALTKYIGETV